MNMLFCKKEETDVYMPYLPQIRILDKELNGDYHDDCTDEFFIKYIFTKYNYLVLFIDCDILVGNAILSINKTTKTATINNLIINKKYRGCGCGKTILRTITMFLKDDYKNINKILLSVDKEHTIAKKLYMSFGFKTTSETMEFNIIK